MADYANLAQINALHAQSQQVQQAIAYLDAGGAPGLMTIGPPPIADEPGIPPDRGMAVATPIHGPFTAQFLTELRQRLVALETELATQLAALGVTATPRSPAKSS
jgi:hypothetical protein